MATNLEIAQTALSFVGKLNYQFGGNNIEGGYGDCSDFTHYVYAVNGYSIGSNTEAQYTMGQQVSRDDIVAGDLVFFKDTYNSGYMDGVSHVGIAIDKNHFVHLSNSGCKISELSGYYDDNFLAAERIRYVTFDGEAIDYDASEVSNASNRATGSSGSDGSESSGVGLEWWGDVVKVVVIVILIITGVVLLAGAVGINLKGVVKNGFK